jgi:hypothetical protein
MIVGMTTLTFVHVVLSLIGIGSGLVVAFGALRQTPCDVAGLVITAAALARLARRVGAEATQGYPPSAPRPA